MNFLELMVVVFVALLVLGPQQLPSIAQKLGKWLRNFQQFFGAVKMILDQPVREAQLQQNIERAEAAEKLRQQPMSDQESTADGKPKQFS